jgi:hypothetical protein
VSLILFALYKLELIKFVAERVTRANGLFFVDNAGSGATGSEIHQVVRTFGTCTGVSIAWVERHELECDTAQTKVAIFTRSRGHK